MSDSEEDDTHLCLRCRHTFIGLDSYIRHRKQKCQRVPNDPPSLGHSSNSPSFCINYTSDLSKSKQLDDSQKEWTLPRNDSESKESRIDVLHSTELLSVRKNEMLEPFLPETHHDNDPCLKADDFFSFLELQSSKTAAFHDVPSKKGKETPPKRGKETTTSKSQPLRSMFEVEAYNRGQHFLEKLDYDEGKKNYSRNDCLDVLTQKQVMFDSEVPGTSKRTDKHQAESNSSESEQEDDEEYFTREPTGGKWKPGGRTWESGSYWSPTTPPSTHTGGKWRPSPPSTHTGGKWKPSPPAQQYPVKSHDSGHQSHQSIDKESVDFEPQTLTPIKSVPPPDHTHGKWLPVRTDSVTPEVRKSGGQVHYWCGACNRKLSSRGIYEKHLKSELHQKRTRQERQLDEDLMVVDKREDGKRVVKRTQAYLNSSLWSKAHKMRLKQDSPTTKQTIKAKTRRRNGMVSILCQVCRCRVWRHLIGKHLVSHFHCRRALSSPEEARKQVLDNIDSVVRQAPFQCGLCRFYCETPSYFLQHWTSAFHNKKDAKKDGIYCCSYCHYETPSTTFMYDHLLGNNHKEVIAVINRSVPIKIEKLSIIKCEVCEKIFRFNFELRNHANTFGHQQEHGTGSDKYQEKVCCSLCPYVSFSRKKLQKHLNFKHSDKQVEGKFFCTVCDLQFDTPEESKEHRYTQEHKYKALKQHQKEEDRVKHCQHCFVVFADVLELKKHLKAEHPDLAYKCARCGSSYSLKQELSRHIRTGCKTLSTEPPSENKDPSKKQCSKCAFTTISETELLYHTAFHTDPVFVQKGDVTSNHLVAKYFCPSCPGLFLKHSLKNHIRSHTGERPYQCKLCVLSFARKDVLTNHMFCIHNLRLSEVYKTSEKTPTEEKTKDVLCAECGASFYNKTTLQQHMQIHKGKNFKCTEPDCVSTFRSAGELQKHVLQHSDARPYQCEHCDYSAKTKAQIMRHFTVHIEERSHKCPYCEFTSRDTTHLNRHLRLHTGARPYHCPHCSYTCNLLENLRKHVLSTKKHPGKCLYSCKEKDCNFATNLAKLFKVHLVKVHGQLNSAATSYIAGLYRDTEDPKHIEQPITVLKKRKPRRKPITQVGVEGTSDSQHSSTLAITNINPTLASASLERTSSDMIKSDVVLQTAVAIEPSDDVIYIQLPPDDALDGYDTGVHFFSPGDGFLSNPDLNQRTLLFENLSRNRTISLGECSGEVIHPLEAENRGFIVIDEVTEPVVTTSSS